MQTPALGSWGGVVDPYDVYGSVSTQTLNPSLEYMGGGIAPAAAASTSPGAYTGPLAGASAFGQPFSFYLGLILFLLLIKWGAEHQSVNLETSYIHIGILNFVIIAIAAKLGDLTLKWLLNLAPIPGLTDLANA